MSNLLKIVLAHTPYKKYNLTPLEEYNVNKMEASIEALKKALEKYNHQVIPLPVDKFFLEKIWGISPDLIFNYSTGVQEKNDQVITASLLEKTGFPYTSSGLKAHFTALYKDLAKSVFITQGIPTPKFQIFNNPDEELNKGLKFPLFVKPLHEGSSFGVDNNSVVFNNGNLKIKIEEINNIYKQPALVEEFVPGREFTLGVWGNSHPQVLPILELKFNNLNNINTQENKNKRAMEQICPALLPENISEELRKLAVKTYKAMGCSDYARVDFRVTEDGKAYVLEINTLPSLKPDRSSFITMARSAGMEYEEIINKIVSIAYNRYNTKRMNKLA